MLRYIFLALTAFLSAFLFQSAQAQESSLPVELSSLPISGCAASSATNRLKLIAQYSDGSGSYVMIQVEPIQAPLPTEASPEQIQQAEAEPVDDPSKDPVNSWQQVIQIPTSGTCQSLNSAQQPSLSSIPQSIRRGLVLDSFRKQIQKVGQEAFLRSLFSFQDDPHHGFDVPEMPTLSADSAWSLGQLGISIPTGWSISP